LIYIVRLTAEFTENAEDAGFRFVLEQTDS